MVAAVLMALLPLAGCKNDSVAETPKYTVKFDRGDNSEYTAELPADITVDSGAKLAAEQLAPLGGTENWIFDGWYDGGTRAMGGEYAVTKDVTLVARWRDRGTVASVTFSPAAGSQVDYNGTVTLTSEEGATVRYTVNGGAEQTGTSPVTVSVTGATTITAHATKEGLKPSAETTASYTLKQYTVTFNTNGGSEVASQTVESGKSATWPATAPTKAGHVFSGWYSDSGLNMVYKFDTGVTADITLYAKWVAPVASVTAAGGVTTNYATFDAALAAANATSGSTLTLLTSVAVTEMVSIAGSGLTLNLNGWSLTQETPDTVALWILESASLTITDSSSEADGHITGNVSNEGALTINGGRITEKDYYAVENYGTLAVNGGTVESLSLDGAVSAKDCGIWNYYNCTAVITGGIVMGTCLALTSDGEATITGGSFKGGEYSVILVGEVPLKLSGSPTISGSDTTKGDIDLSGGASITLTGPLTGDTTYRVLVQSGNTVAQSDGTYSITEADAQKFVNASGTKGILSGTGADATVVFP